MTATMKCVCPMGGDRTCPDDCPIAAYWSLAEVDRKATRKPIAEKLYSQGYTMATIAIQLGVTEKTISLDLNSYQGKNSKPARTASNPKGAGRPKGRKSKPKQTDPVRDEILAAAGNGKSSTDLAREHGVKDRAVRHLLEHERIRQQAFEELLGAAAAKNFSEKGVMRIEDAIRIHKARLDRAFEARVNDEVRRRIAAADDVTRKQNTELRHENLRLSQLLNQHGVFTESQYAKLMMAVHPDNSASEPVRRELQTLLNDKNIQRRLIKNETATAQ